jgi:hypothetical protein
VAVATDAAEHITTTVQVKENLSRNCGRGLNEFGGYVRKR